MLKYKLLFCRNYKLHHIITSECWVFAVKQFTVVPLPAYYFITTVVDTVNTFSFFSYNADCKFNPFSKRQVWVPHIISCFTNFTIFYRIYIDARRLIRSDRPRTIIMGDDWVSAADGKTEVMESIYEILR